MNVRCGENTRCLRNAGLMLGQRRRRWPDINPALGQRPVFAGMWCDVITEADFVIL